MEATPTSARYPAAGDSASSAAAWQPLPQNAGVEALISRFSLVLPDSVVPCDQHRFKSDATVTAFKQHLRDHSMQRERDAASGSGAGMTIVQRPAFDHVKFFVAPSGISGTERMAWSVPSRALATEMVQRGYEVLSVTHLPNDDRMLPPPVAERCRGAAGSLSTDGEPPPESLKVPDRVPDIDRSASAPTPAAQVVEQMELKVKLFEHHRRVVYSPIRLWTPDARRDSGFKANQSTPLAARCKIYLYIRRILQQEPSTIDLTYDALRSAAEGRLVKLKKNRARAMTESGESVPADAIVGDWWSAAAADAMQYCTV